MTEIIQRAQILIEQERYKDAEDLLKQALASNPNNSLVLSLLAEVNLQMERYDDATQLINSAISTSPDNAYLFGIKGRLYMLQEQYTEAQEQFEHAILLNPAEADYYAYCSFIKLQRKDYKEAVELADLALALNPENILALNNRSRALVKLKDYEGSYQTIEGALREDPNNDYTHANYGWNLLEQGDHKKALEHFKEALQNNPSSEYAQEGMVEALKANNIFYRLFLKYSFWIGNLREKYQWGVLIGFMVISRFIRTMAQKNETLRPFLIPVIILLTLFAFSTWVMTPIGNLFLRLNKFGKHLLSDKEKRSSNFVGISLLICIAGLIAYLVTQDQKMLTIAAFGFAMMVPLGSMFAPAKGKALLHYAIAMTVIGAIAIFNTFNTGNLFNGYSILFLLGFVGYQWVANYLLIRAGNR